MKFACNRYFSLLATENDIIILLFSQRRLLSVHQMLTKCIRISNVKKNTFFHFSVKDLVKFSKNSNDTGPTQVP